MRFSVSQSQPALLPGVSSHSHDPRTDAAGPAEHRKIQAGEQPSRDAGERRGATTDSSPKRRQPLCSGEGWSRTRLLVVHPAMQPSGILVYL